MDVMMPGMNPRDIKSAMKKLGIKQEEIDATEVIIKTKDKDLIIKNPQVSKINMMGQDTIQIIGDVQELAKINDDDIQTVMEQAHVDRKTAMTAIEKSNGDLAAAILELTDN